MCKYKSLLFVGLCSAIMSTMDSLINTGALSLTIDVYKKYINPQVSPAGSVRVGRISTLIVAALSLFIALHVQSVLTISWIGSDFLTTGAFIPLVLGFVWLRGTAIAAKASMIFGLLFSSYNLLHAMGVSLPVYWEIPSAKHAIIGILSSLFIYIVVSLCSTADKEKSREFIKKAGVVSRFF